MKQKNPILEKAGKTVLFALTLSIAIYSCKKIEEKTISSTTPGQTTGSTRSGDGGSYDDGMTDEEVHAKIEHLVSVIWNNTADEWDAVKPTNETDAMDFMEGVLNYTHGDAVPDNEQIATYSSEFAIPASGGSYSLAEYKASFETMSNYIVGVYNGIDDPDKCVSAINLEPLMGQPNGVTITVFLGKGPHKTIGYEKKKFTSAIYDNYKYDRVSGQCSSALLAPAACVYLEDYGRWNIKWQVTGGGTLARLPGYYSKVGSRILDITNVPHLTGPNRLSPSIFTSEFLNFQIFASDLWKGLHGMPCLKRDQLNYYLDQMWPLFQLAVSTVSTKEFINLTVNPKYRRGGSFSNPFGWGNPGAPGKNNVGPSGQIVTRSNENAEGRGTFYEHYYIFDYGRYIRTNPQFRVL